ncbi:MAG: hypothetical protein GX786_07070 [Clostridiales bacterium]|nr:hypothetical protein [Clostridiales bacterium]
MSLTILCMLFFSVMLLIWEWRNKYYMLFILMMVGMSLSMMSLMGEISKRSNYLLPSNYISAPLELTIYTLINSFLRIPLSLNTQLRNLGISLYLFAIVLFAGSFHNSIRHEALATVSKKKRSLIYYWRFSRYCFFCFIIRKQRIYFTGNTI